MLAETALAMAAAFGACALLTGLLYRAAPRLGLVDLPNERSSHSWPTASGGGLAIAAVVAGYLLWSLHAGHAPDPVVWWALLLGGSLMAAVGFLDDRYDVAVQLRLLAQLVVVAAGLHVIGGLPPLGIGAGPLETGWVGEALAVLACVWFLNLFNFMDGIDGIAAAESAFVCLAAALAIAANGGPAGLVQLWAVIGAASLGFLPWNWAPARIFLGDAGSAFLGFTIGLLLVYSAQVADFTVWTALILVAPFAADTTLTLLRRMLRGERWYSAHRRHAYQWLARRWGSHAGVTVLFVAVNLLLVAPLAWWSLRAPAAGPWLALSLLAALTVAAWFAGAGRPEPRDPAGP